MARDVAERVGACHERKQLHEIEGEVYYLVKQADQYLQLPVSGHQLERIDESENEREEPCSPVK